MTTELWAGAGSVIAALLTTCGILWARLTACQDALLKEKDERRQDRDSLATIIAKLSTDLGENSSLLESLLTERNGGAHDDGRKQADTVDRSRQRR